MRIGRVALILIFAAYSESIVGPTLGVVLHAPAVQRREYFAAALDALYAV